MDNDTKLLVPTDNNDDEEIIQDLFGSPECSTRDDQVTVIPSTSRGTNRSPRRQHHQDLENGNELTELSATVVVRRKNTGKKDYDDFNTIDWVRDRAKYLSRHRILKINQKRSWLDWFSSFHDAWSGWLIVSAVGVMAGLCAGIIDIGTEWMNDLRVGVCSERFWLNKKACCWSSNQSSADGECPDWHGWSEIFSIFETSSSGINGFEYSVYVLISIVFGYLAALLVRMLAPYACGSGIPEIKTILSGFVIRTYLGKWVLLIKSLTMMMAVSAGLSLGKEGPLVHVACCCGNMLSRLFPKYHSNEAKKREVLSAAAAAGVSVAFGAPIGGVLFSLEEISYYFPLKTLWRSFFSALMAALVLSYINPYGNGHLVMFEVSYNSTWHLFELVPFIILGIFGGLYGAFFIKLNIMWSKLRKTSFLRKYPVTEVVVVTALTAIASYPNPYTRENTSSMIQHLFQQCDQSDSTDLCNYINNGTYVINANDRDNFPTLPAGPLVLKSLWLLALAMVLKAVATIFTFGMKVPAGLFIPSMAVGACFGRILGVGMEQWYYYNPNIFFFKIACLPGHVCVEPGLYSMVGAAATLGGVTKMTVSLVVIIFELTGGLQYIVPIMIAVMTSKWVGDAFVKGGIYDCHIQLNGYPFLDSKEEIEGGTIASDFMQPRNSNPLVSISLNDSTIGGLLDLMKESPFQGYPIIYSRESQHLIGFVTRKDLQYHLDFAMQTNANVSLQSKVYFSKKAPTTARNDPSPLSLLEIVDMSPLQITTETSVDTVVDIFRKLGTRTVLVTHNGRVLGVITKKDILRHIAELSDNDPHAIGFH